MIPIKCHTCGAVIADKYRYYLEEVRKRKMNNDVKKEPTFNGCSYFVYIKYLYYEKQV